MTPTNLFWFLLLAASLGPPRIVLGQDEATSNNNTDSAFQVQLVDGGLSCFQATPIPIGAAIQGTTNDAPVLTDLVPADACQGQDILPLYDGFAVNHTTSQGVWYTVTHPSNISSNTLELFVDLCGSTYDTAVSVFSDCSQLAASCVVANEDTITCENTGRSYANFTATPNLPYFILVHGFPDETGTYLLHVSTERRAPPLPFIDPMPESGATTRTTVGMRQLCLALLLLSLALLPDWV